MGTASTIRRRSPFSLIASALIAGVLGACAPSTGYVPSGDARSTAINGDDGSFSYRAAEITVHEALRNISQRYIDPVNMDELALGGLRGLATIDPALRIEMSADARSLLLLRSEDALAEVPMPDTDTASAITWSHLTTAVLRAGREKSTDLRNASNERVYEAMFDGMLANLDIFSRYAGAEEARANRARRDGFGGIGIRFAKTDDGILVTHVTANSPAMDAGLKPGDVITRVNDTQTADKKLRDVAKMLRGPVGSLINLTITRLSANEAAPERLIDFNLARAHIVPETVRASVSDDVLTIRISSFNKNTSSSTHDILRAHDAAFRNGTVKGVVIDLRGNPGGLLSQAVNVSDLFVEEGRIISTQGRHPDSYHQYDAGGVDLARGLPVAVLLDGESASAAEIVGSALQDLGRAVVIGSASYGKGTVQTVIRLPNDGEVTLTWSRFVSPSGYAIHGLGVMPAVCATDKAASESTIGANKAENILSAAHIDAGRGTMDAWRAAGTIFDGRRNALRRSCPARAFNAGENGDLLMKLADRVIHDPALYQRALLLSQPVSTASR